VNESSKTRPSSTIPRTPFNPTSPYLRNLIALHGDRLVATRAAQLARAEVVPGSLPRERFSEF
jgi:hypothetical protein